MPTYEQILLSMPPGIKKKVLHILAGHKGSNNRIARNDLVKRVFGIFSDDELTDTRDRMVREVIAELRDEGNFICSDSGVGGYWMASNYEDIEMLAGELDSRAMKLLEKSRTLKARAMEWFGPQIKMKI